MKPIPFLLIGVLSLWLAAAGFCLSGEDVVALKGAGVSDKTIEVMVRERTVETCAFTVEEILGMKRAGIGEETLQVLILDRASAREQRRTVYGDVLRSLDVLTVGDLVKLKEAGMSQETLRSLIAAALRGLEDDRRAEAEALLNKMGILIEGRGMHE